MARLLGGLVLLFSYLVGSADQFLRAGDYEIHFASFPSTVIPPDVARVYGITRSDNRLITNISVIKAGEHVPARVRGFSKNLLAQQQELTFSEVVEKEAIYYLTSQIIGERDTIEFAIEVTPAGSEQSYPLKFTRTYQ